MWIYIIDILPMLQRHEYVSIAIHIQPQSVTMYSLHYQQANFVFRLIIH